MSTTPKSALPLPTQQTVNLGELELTNPSEITSSYADNAAVFQMQHDFRLVFTQVVLEAPGKTPRVELRASIALAPTMLKALHAAIGSTLEAYEKRQGEIAWPPKQLTTK